jgi:hypothetical protein
MPGYNTDVWFSTKAITNIIASSNLIQQYRITYDSEDKILCNPAVGIAQQKVQCDGMTAMLHRQVLISR